MHIHHDLHTASSKSGFSKEIPQTCIIPPSDKLSNCCLLYCFGDKVLVFSNSLSLFLIHEVGLCKTSSSLQSPVLCGAKGRTKDKSLLLCILSSPEYIPKCVGWSLVLCVAQDYIKLYAIQFQLHDYYFFKQRAGSLELDMKSLHLHTSSLQYWENCIIPLSFIIPIF